MKTQHCEDCSKADWTKEKLACMIGHKPRFYLPKGTYPHFENDWGYKRKCGDFIKGTPKGVEIQKMYSLKPTTNKQQ